ncbi:sugar transferase [Micromonospora sp. WMMC415]|uniref:sugar transferase n=1 Tax=Micromonospora sp. WMMC415 TaxID=2675222 RepID=UPI0012B4AED6|nr:sugar transferase [Micromonospora sp. WMMC415]QGN49544.1 sugar transferase [Micromonospora sp. WMMC415]
MTPERPPRSVRPDRGKRALDVAAAAFLLVLLAPVMAVVALLVAAGLGRPVLFRQRRAGRHGEPFELVKFRTMRPLDPRRGLVADAERLTPLGRWLRSTSLDELPTLWNVLRGDMSLVGPRPLLPEYLSRYSSHQARRHEVRPGVTGLAQVRGRNGLSWEEKFDLDVEYVETHSLRLDLSILVATVRTVLRREGISAAGVATAPEFLGTPAGPAPRYAEAATSSSVPRGPAVTVRQGGRR